MDLECNSGGDYFFILQAGLHYSLDLLLLKDGESLHFGIPKLCPPPPQKKKSCQGCYLCSLVFTVAKKKIKSDRLSL